MPNKTTIDFSETSSERVFPACQHFGQCGGCQLQHLPLEAQLESKQNLVQKNLSRWASPENILKIIPSPETWHYRRRAQFHISPRGEVGFFEAGRQKVLPIESCPVVAEEINQSLPRIRELAATDLKQKHPNLLSYEATLEDGEVRIQRRDEDWRSFLQINAAANRQLIDYLEKTFRELSPSSVLELFAGSGNLTFPLVPHAKRWTAVESSPAAVAAGKEASGECPGLEWITGDVRGVLKKLVSSKARYDAVLLDPPRQGIGEGLDDLLKLAPPHIFYLSCSLEALRRDLEKIGRKNYEVRWVQPFDFFPHTVHLETLVALRQNRDIFKA